MAAPTFIQEAETSFSTTTSPKTTASFTVQSGDVLVCFGLSEDSGGTINTPTNSGTAFTWSLQQSVVVSGYCTAYVWTTTASVGQSMTVSATAGGSNLYGINALTFRDSSGVGSSSKTNVTNGAPTLNLTTTQADSAIVVCNADWTATDGASRTWRTNAGALTEQTYFRNASKYTCYGGYHANAGAVATYAVGLSAPGAQTYSIVAVEIKGTAGAAATSLPIVGRHLITLLNHF